MREEQIKNELLKTKNYINYNKWSNSRTDYGYHSFNIDEINIIGQRSPKIRLEEMRKYIDFKDKNIIDMGCNVGSMLFHLQEIKYGIGFDYDYNCINAALNIKKILNNKKTEFHVFDFDKDNYEDMNNIISFKPDIIFILSMGAWVRDFFKLIDFCLKMESDLILETNNDILGKKEINYLKDKGLNPILIIDDSDDDSTIDNKKNRKTYLIKNK
jgi:SAM-dependent methyltransferase